MKPRLLPLAGLLLSLPGFAQWSPSGNTASKSFRLGTNNNVSLRMFTNGTQKAIITPSGNVGFGVDYPTAPFHVAKAAQFDSSVVIKGSLTGKDIKVGDVFKVEQEGDASVHVEGRNIGLFVRAIDREDPSNTSPIGIAVSSEFLAISANGGGKNGTGVRAYGDNMGINASVGELGLAAVYAYSLQRTHAMAGIFDGPVYASELVLASDARLKTEVKDFGGLDLIGKLKPKNYAFAPEKGIVVPEGRHYGLMAQDVATLAPSLVKNVKLDSGELKAVNYIELVPVLVKGMQEQQAMIEELKAEVARLKGTTNAALSSAWIDAVSNPVKGTARMRYNVPEGKGQLLVLDVTGRQVKSIMLKGAGTLNLDVSGLASGVYNYSLVVDGRPVETKRMTVQR